MGFVCPVSSSIRRSSVVTKLLLTLIALGTICIICILQIASALRNRKTAEFICSLAVLLLTQIAIVLVVLQDLLRLP